MAKAFTLFLVGALLLPMFASSPLPKPPKRKKVYVEPYDPHKYWPAEYWQNNPWCI